jgi:hypothetical protein
VATALTRAALRLSPAAARPIARSDCRNASRPIQTQPTPAHELEEARFGGVELRTPARDGLGTRLGATMDARRGLVRDPEDLQRQQEGGS